MPTGRALGRNLSPDRKELEWLSPQACVFLKEGLDRRMPPATICVATSNGAGKLPRALLERFRIRHFRADAGFAAASAKRLTDIWRLEAGDAPLPSSFARWGWNQDETGRDVFSLRLALDMMQVFLPRKDAA